MTEHQEGRAPAGVPDQERRPDTEQNSEAAAKEVERDLVALEQTKRERDEYLDLARRTKADFENYRKRVAGEARDAERRGRASLVRELLPVLDNLERALKASGESEGSLFDGVKLVLGELESVLQRNGIESYEPAGEQFDP